MRASVNASTLNALIEWPSLRTLLSEADLMLALQYEVGHNSTRVVVAMSHLESIKLLESLNLEHCYAMTLYCPMQL